MRKELTIEIARVAGIKVGKKCPECGEPNAKYWYGACPCGWHGTADKASGGGPLGDTGDYGDVHCPACDSEDELEIGPCPTCAQLRELAKLCWHEWVDEKTLPSEWLYKARIFTCSCGHMKTIHQGLPVFRDSCCGNPIYTIQSMRYILQDMGEWEKFKKMMQTGMWPENEILDNHHYLDILTSDELMAQAVLSYLRGLK